VHRKQKCGRSTSWAAKKTEEKKMSRKATKGHLIVGMILVILSLASLVITYIHEAPILKISIFFLGVWGGVEIGRYLEYKLSRA
jgi:hypothetical protein